MNDYLTQLVARNLDPTDLVRPRPIALFAPERAVEPRGESELLPALPAAEPAPAQPMRSAPPAEPAQHATTQARTELLGSDPSSMRPLERQQPPAVDQDTRPIVPPPADQAPRSAPIAAHQPPVQIPAQPSLLIAPQSAPRDTPSFTHSRLPPPAPVVAPPPSVIERTTIVSLPAAQPALAPERIAIERPALAEPRAAAASPQPAPAPQIVAQPPAALAARDPQPAPAQAPLIVPAPPVTVIQPARPAAPAASQPAAAPSEPIIHVTIGRVEVRATPAPAPAARPKSAPAQATSLDEYLRQRSGGRR